VFCRINVKELFGSLNDDGGCVVNCLHLKSAFVRFTLLICHFHDNLFNLFEREGQTDGQTSLLWLNQRLHSLLCYCAGKMQAI